MAKISVGGTLAQAFHFLRGDILRLLSVTAAPMAIMWLPAFFLRDQLVALSTQVAAEDMSGLGQVWPMILGFYVMAFLLMAMMVIGIARLALGLDRNWFYLSLGAPVWRLLGSLLLLVFVLVLGWLATILAGVIGGFVMGLLTALTGIGALSSLFAFLAVVTVFCGYVYCLVRLTFLLVPVIAAEEKSFALVRSWTLSHGNFWHMFAITLVILVPLIVFELVFVLGYLFKGVTFPTDPANLQEMEVFQAAINARSTEMMAAFYDNWYISYPLTVLLVAIFYGATIAAQCFAYRQLAQDEKGEVSASPP